MWIFSNDAFVSAVRHRDQPGAMMIRARLRGDLERFFGDSIDTDAITETPRADYRFRCVVTDQVFTAALLRAATAIDYPNFKSSIAYDDDFRHDAYMDVWSAMHRAQSKSD